MRITQRLFHEYAAVRGMDYKVCLCVCNIRNEIKLYFAEGKKKGNGNILIIYSKVKE